MLYIAKPALIYAMPTVAAGGGHILNIDIFCCKFVKEATGQRAARAKTNTLLTKKKKKKENKEKKLFLNKEKLCLLLKLLQIRRPNWRAQSAIPSAGKESGKESADSAKQQNDGALNAGINIPIYHGI